MLLILLELLTESYLSLTLNIIKEFKQEMFCGEDRKNEMRKIEENYQRITDDRRLFDIRFWQSQGDLAIFEAVTEMLNDYFLIRGKNADESRLQRTIESFRKA